MRVIEVHNPTKRYGEVLAVDGISFSVAPGETVGLLGGNGAAAQGGRVWLACGRTLAMLVQVLNEDLFGGAVFAFRSRRGGIVSVPPRP